MVDYPIASLERSLLENLPKASTTERLYVALSGGIDSKVLLHALVRLRDLKLVNNIYAIHVNHGLQGIAGRWLDRCQSDCDEYQVELITTQLDLGKNCVINIEAAARNGRYHFFESILEENDWLVMAHHQNDQAETLLFRLLRGCGLDGAGSMPEQRRLGKGKLIRPLLNIARSEIEKYARQQKISWIEDPTNYSQRFSRNYLRHQVLPLIEKKWPGYAKTLSRFTQLASEQSQLLEDIAAEDLRCVIEGNQTINISKLELKSLSRQKNLLHYWGNVYTKNAPSNSEVNELIKQLSAAQEKSIKVTFAGKLVRSYAAHLFLISKEQPLPITEKVLWEKIQEPLTLINGITILSKDSKSTGLRLPGKEEQVWVDCRRGGERCLPDYRGRSAELKKIYQEKNIPPWRREWLPVVYFNQDIVAVPGVFIASSFIAKAGEPALQLGLQRAC